MKRLPALPSLRAFEAVARLGSVRAAAQELHVTPGAVSQQVKALEAELGLRLLARRGRHIALTEAGRAGREELIAAFRLLREATQRIAAAGGRRRLRLSVDPSFAATWLIARLERIRRDTGCEVAIEATKERADFDRADADAAIRFGAEPFPGLVAHRLFADEVCPVCSPRLTRGPRGLRTPADLGRYTLLHLEWNPRAGRWPDWQTWLAAAGVEGIDAQAGPRFTDHALALQAAVEGQGVALGSTALVADHIAAKRLVAPFSVCLDTPFAYYLVYPRASATRAEIRALADWLTAEAARS
ncbi:MAG: transcriptional regulator GcvA [Pseudomonadota bacterium]